MHCFNLNLTKARSGLTIRRRLSKFRYNLGRLSRVLLMRQMPEIGHFRRLAHPLS